MEHKEGAESSSEKPGLIVKDVDSKSFFIQSKKFYIDVKENRRGKFLKMSEVAPNGHKMKIVMDMATGNEFRERLSEFCDILAQLGTKEFVPSPENDGKIKSETIFRENRRYYLDLKENARGRFLKVSMTLPSHERCQIVIPAQGMADVRDALVDILNQHGCEDTSPNLHKSQANALHTENKTFFFDVGTNPRGNFLRISEVCGAFRSMITIPEDAWNQFTSMMDQATSEPESSPPAPELESW